MLKKLALCFIDSFKGPVSTVENVVLKSSANNEIVELNYSSPSSSSTGSLTNTADAEMGDTSVDETLYLLHFEKFGVSDECYHELTQLHQHLHVP